MRKLILLAAIAIASVNVSNAKSPFEFGAKIGGLVNFSNLNTDLSGSDNINDFSTKIGFEAGFQARVNLPLNFMIQPELVYTRTNGEFVSKLGEALKIRSNFIEVPVLVGWQISMFRVMLGPTFRFNMDDVLTSERETGKFAPSLETFVMGYQAGVGVDLGRFTIDARYCGNFSTEIDESIMYDNKNQTLSYNASKVAISVGFMIFK